jgi:DNA repair protein RadC
VFCATAEELCRVEGIGPSVADFIIKAGALISDKSETVSDNPFDDYMKVGEFLAQKLSCEKDYKTAMMLFDNRMRLIDFAVIYDLDYSSGAVKPDALIEFAIKNRASIVVTAHTHPHGPLFPTAGDMATNSAICTALKSAGISHAEHYIISGERFLGVTHQMKLSLVQSPELDRFYKSREEALGV